MEKELLVKVQFFACYWGQKVFVNPMLSAEPVSNIYVFDIAEPEDLEHEYLELKPLSSITDEDLLNVSKVYQAGFVSTWTEKQKIIEAAAIIRRRINSDYSNWANYGQLLALTDFLRSRGYALPYMGISVDTLVKWGWIKLK